MTANGEELGRYRLAAGQAAVSGAVLPAEDTLLERRVGVLLVPDAVATDPARLSRVRQEVERAASFIHPNAAATYGVEEGGGRVFVTLEPMAGSGLAEVLARSPLDRATAVQVALALCDVLASARREGVVHGSLSPADVVLGDDDGVTVGGFGLRELRLVLRQEAGVPAAAAGWQAPETAAGLLPDHRADLHALARMVREMLAGDLGEAPEWVALETVLERCSSEEPDRRPSSVADLRRALERIQGELARPSAPEEPDGSPARRRFSPAGRWAALAAAALLLALGIWALWRVAGGSPTAAERSPVTPPAAAVERVDLAVLPFRGGDGEGGVLARGFAREVSRLLARDRRVSVVDDGSAARAAALEVELRAAAGAGAEQAGSAARRRAADRLGVAHLLQGSFVWQSDEEISRAEATVRLTRAADGELLWRETLEAFFNEVGELQGTVAAGVRGRLGGGRGRPAPAPTRSAPAYQAYLEGLGRSASGVSPAELSAAATAFASATELDPVLLEAHLGQIDVQLRLVESGAGEEALAAARRALAAARGIAATEPEVERAAGRLELAADGDPAAARQALETALERLPGDPMLLRSIAWLDRREGRWQEAIEALASARRRAPLDVALATDLALALSWSRRFNEARREVERLESVLPGEAAAALLRSDLELRHRGDATAARRALETLPQEARAAPSWQRRMLRLEIYQGEFEAALDRLPRLGLSAAEELIERAWIRRHMGEPRRSAALFERARDQLDDRLESDPANPWLSSLLAQAYAGTGGVHLAARMGQRAVAQLPVTMDAVAGAELVERLARTYLLAGDSEHALDELAFLLEIPSPVTVAVLRLDPTWRPLAGDPRLRQLLERFAA